MTRWQREVIRKTSTATSYKGKSIVTTFRLEFESGRKYTKRILGFGGKIEALKIGDVVVTVANKSGKIVDIKA